MDFLIAISFMIILGNFVNILNLSKKLERIHEDLYELKENLNKRFGLDEDDDDEI